MSSWARRRWPGGVSGEYWPELKAMSLPVVTTSVVAEGLVLNGYGDLPVLMADDEEGFFNHIVRLFNNGEERKLIAADGRQFIERHFDWTESASKFENMCLEAANAINQPVSSDTI